MGGLAHLNANVQGKLQNLRPCVRHGVNESDVYVCIFIFSRPRNCNMNMGTRKGDVEKHVESWIIMLVRWLVS